MEGQARPRGDEGAVMIDRVFVARHGRTAFNADRRLLGLSNPPLDDVGRAEVDRLAAVLTGFEQTVVICSPLQRAVTTAEGDRRRRARVGGGVIDTSTMN
jgi:bisphosphoglycerate-dependent phosphoglycerate mutase